MFSPGQALGNYRILSQIGIGGMGVVYLAEHPLIGKKVAVKVIHRELSGNREVVGRFVREAKAIGNEHIVQIHDFGQTNDGDHFYIMEYLEGRNLADALQKDGRFPVTRALHVCAQIASGLGAAHAQGIIHRDLKPDNVMLVPKLGDRDFVKVLDFGLAKLMAAGNDARRLTAQGVVLGTPQYMSPEACESKEDIDHRSDIYSLGVLMFQVLTGRVPFGGESMGEILVKHVAHPPPAPRAFNPSIPPSVEQIILRCLAKEPDQRFANMRELRKALLDADGYLAMSPPVVPSALAPEEQTVCDPGVGANGHGAPPANPSLPAVAGPEARTQFMSPAPAAPAPAPRAPAAPPGPSGPERTAYLPEGGVLPLPEAPRPAPPQNATMMIGTPHGYRPGPGRKVWPVVVAVVAVLAVGGGGAVLIAFPSILPGGGSEDAPVVEAAAPEARDPEAQPPATAAGDSAVATAADAAPAAPSIARIEVTTRPEGATVFNAEGMELGVTPTTVALPANGEEHELILQHPQAHEVRRKVLVTGDAAVAIELALREEARQGEPRETTRRVRTRVRVRDRDRDRDRGKQGGGRRDQKRAGDGILPLDF